MTNNSIEEEFRLTVPFYSPAIDFRHHKTVWMTRLLVSQGLFEDMRMKHSMSLLDFRL
jgi:hypothetical protein